MTITSPVTESSPFSSLPTELSEKLVGLLDGRSLRAWSASSTSSRQTIDSILRNFWESRLKTSVFRPLMLRIENDYKNNFKNDLSYLHLFCRLEAKFIKLEATLPLQTADLRLPTSQTDFENLQNQMQKTALTRIWSRLAPNIPNAPTLNNEQAIRAWLIDPNNAGAIGPILNLSDCWLTTLPDELSHLTGLTHLIVDHNLFTTLPDWVSRLPGLEVFNASYNGISQLPENFGESLNSLKGLHLSNNALTELNLPIGKFPMLQTLDVSGNRLDSLPESTGEIRYLAVINVSGNRLRALPHPMANLKYLTKLFARDNRISAIPDCFVNLRLLPLVKMDLVGNPIQTVPERMLGRNPNILTLDFASTQRLQENRSSQENIETTEELSERSIAADVISEAF
jgi:hypothetical protein